MDAFVSHKWKDAKPFVNQLVRRLIERRLIVWQDDLDLKPGHSVVRGIENGLSKAKLLILVLSKNYFSGWSDMERNAIMHLFISNSRKIFPIWFEVDYAFVLENAPLLADVKGFQVSGDVITSELIESIMYAANPDYVETKLLPLSEQELPELPSQFEWYFARNINFALAKPHDWFATEIAAKADRTIVLSREDMTTTHGIYETGLTLNIMTNVNHRFGLPAEVVALNWFEVTKAGPKNRVIQASSQVVGGVQTQSLTVVISDTGLDDVISRVNICGANSLDLAWCVQWETLLKNYDSSRPVADVMLSHIAYAFES